MLLGARGDRVALAAAVLRVDSMTDKTALLARLSEVVERFTFESKHGQRAQLIVQAVRGRSNHAT